MTDRCEIILRSPERISNLHNFGVTPFGIYCLDCRVPIGNINDTGIINSVKMHICRKNHEVADGLSASSLIKALRKAIRDKFGTIDDYTPWIKDMNVNTYKCPCGVRISSQSNMQRHIIKAETKDNTKSIHCKLPDLSVRTVCGRVIPKDIFEAMLKKPFVSVRSSKSSPASLTTARKNDTCPYIPIKTKNRQWITTTLNHVRNQFTPYVNKNESLEPYLPSLKLLTLHENGSVVDKIKEYVGMIDGDSAISDSTLSFVLGCFEKWVKLYCREHVNVLDGKIRFQLQSFFDESILVNSGYNLNFNMRDNEDTIWKEMKIIIELGWKLDEKKSTANNGSTLMSSLKSEIREKEDYHHSIVTDSAVQDMIQGLLLQRFLHKILTEHKDNAYHLLTGHEIIILRLFEMKKNIFQNSKSI